MTGIVLALIIAALFFILGVRGEVQLEFLMIFVIAVLVAMCLFFMVSVVILALSKKKTATFDGIETDKTNDDNSGEKKTEYAFYLVDGRRLKNLFPAEKAGRQRIYSKGEQKVYEFSLFKRQRVLDMHSVLIIACGTVLSTVSLIFAVNLLIMGS